VSAVAKDTVRRFHIYPNNEIINCHSTVKIITKHKEISERNIYIIIRIK